MTQIAQFRGQPIARVCVLDWRRVHSFCIFDASIVVACAFRHLHLVVVFLMTRGGPIKHHVTIKPNLLFCPILVNLLNIEDNYFKNCGLILIYHIFN